MMQLPVPEDCVDAVAILCAEGILGNETLRSALGRARATLIQQETLYRHSAHAGSLHKVQYHGGPDDLAVVGTLTKRDLVKLYNVYLVEKNRPARRIYDAIMNAAADRCPFCGGIGVPRNLDHFLPKSGFPQFSVLPLNLVPSCRDCNMDDKGAGYAQAAHDQVLHPYCDKAIFFKEQWIVCEYAASSVYDVGEFVYLCAPPASWGQLDKQRAKKHFEGFRLGHRYALKAAEALRPALGSARHLLRMADRQAVAAHYLELANESPFINHWQTGMYQALSRWLAQMTNGG